MKFTIKIVAILTALGLAAVLTFVSATLAVAQSSEVWVDDDYCSSCINDCHTWDYRAFDNIQDGIDAVASPGTVFVAAGIYEGKIVLKAQVTLLGTGIGVSIIDGMGLKEGDDDQVVDMASDSKISGFSIINGGWFGVECYNVSAIIEGNLVANHEAVGIVLTGAGSGNSIVSNNIVTNCASYMPKVRYVGAIFGNSVYGSPQIIHNTVVGNHHTGIGFCHPGTPMIKNNIVVGNAEGIGVCDNVDPINSHNNSWNNGGYNWFGLLQGVGAISSDPLFVDEVGGNYHLKENSPCMDSGTDAGVYIDIGGDMRPFGMGFDMGADEFMPTIWIQTEDYNQGGQHVGYYDKTLGNAGGQYRNDDVDIWWYYPKTYYTGSNSTGEWLNYTIDVPADGNYRLDIKVATPKDNRRVHVELDGVDKTGPLTVPNTGWWTTWQTLSANVALNAGQQVMRLVIDYGGLNIDQISLVYIGGTESVETPTIKPNGGTFIESVDVTLATATASATIYYTTDGSDPITSGTSTEYISPYTLTEDTTVRAYAMKTGVINSDVATVDFTILKEPVLTGLTIQAEDYDRYYDRTPGNAGGHYRNDDVDIWWYYPNTYYTGSNSTGEWLNYTIDVPADGEYKINLKVASALDNRRLHVEFDDEDKTGPLTVPNTGWWTTWQTLSANVTLNAGRQVMRLVIDYGGLNIDWISLVFVGDLLMNGSFENGIDTPSDWMWNAWQQSAIPTWDDSNARSGDKSARIDSTTPNDARWIQSVEVEPDTLYFLSGWIKTENVGHTEESVDAGANLCLYDTWTRSEGVFGTNDWTRKSVLFNSGGQSEVVVGARLGYWSGTTTGTAWFDDIKLEPIVPMYPHPSWKILVLIYQETDFEFTYDTGTHHHYVASMTADEMDRAALAARQFVELDIPALTSGNMIPSITVRFPERALNKLSPIGGGWWPSPEDTAPERDPEFDSVIVIWDTRAIDTTTNNYQWIGYGDGLAAHRGTGQTYLSMQIDAAISRGHRNVFKHEWGHCILFYFDVVETTPIPAVSNHASVEDYVNCQTGKRYVWTDETLANPIPNSIYNNASGFTHDYYSGLTATADRPKRCLGVTLDAWALGGPVSHSGNINQ